MLWRIRLEKLAHLGFDQSPDVLDLHRRVDFVLVHVFGCDEDQPHDGKVLQGGSGILGFWARTAEVKRRMGLL